MMCVVIVGCGLLWCDSNENAEDKKITALLPFYRNRKNPISKSSSSALHLALLLWIFWWGCGGSQLRYNRQSRSGLVWSGLVWSGLV